MLLGHSKYLRDSGSASQPCASDKRPLSRQYAFGFLDSLKQHPNDDRDRLFALELMNWSGWRANVVGK